ncbi:hypothetical protein LDENG_00173010 [Lucifuga dentata]|nr:hypothetical protein LDENG_00173010 [Lucifuga dentata]
MFQAITYIFLIGKYNKTILQRYMPLSPLKKSFSLFAYTFFSGIVSSACLVCHSPAISACLVLSYSPAISACLVFSSSPPFISLIHFRFGRCHLLAPIRHGFKPQSHTHPLPDCS